MQNVETIWPSADAGGLERHACQAHVSKQHHKLQYDSNRTSVLGNQICKPITGTGIKGDHGGMDHGKGPSVFNHDKMPNEEAAYRSEGPTL